MPNPSQEPPVSYKAPNEDLKDMDVLCTFKIKVGSQNLDHGYIKDQQPYQWGLKIQDVLCTFKIKIESWNFEYGYIKDQWPYLNQEWDAEPQSGSSSLIQSFKSELQGHGCSLHPQNHNREPKVWTKVYQRPVTISESTSRCWSPVRYLKYSPKPQIKT